MSGPYGWEVTASVDRSGNVDKTMRDGEPIPEPDSWHRARLGGITLWFRTAMARDGQLVCRELSIESEKPLNTTALKRIPLTAILEHLTAVADVGTPASPTTGMRRWIDTRGPDEDAAMRAAWFVNDPQGTDTTAGRPRRGSEGPSLEHLEQFAQAYRLAVRTDPRRAIARTVELLEEQHGFIISRATAHRWRDACRRTDPPLLDPRSGV